MKDATSWFVPPPRQRIPPYGIATLLALLLHLLLPLPLASGDASSILLLTPQLREIKFTPYLAHLPDPQGGLTPQEIFRPRQQARFVPGAGGKSQGYTSAVHWFRLQVHNPTPEAIERILEFGPPYLDEVRVFLHHAPDTTGKWEEVGFGDHLPVTSRPLRTHLFTLPLLIPPGQTTTLHFRISSISILMLDGTLLERGLFEERQAVVLPLVGAYLGIMVMLVISNLFMGGWLRDETLIAYALYVLSLVIVHGCLSGLATLALEPEAPWVMDLVLGGGVLGGIASSYLLWDRILEMDRFHPRLHRLLVTLALLHLLALPLAVTPLYRIVGWLVPMALLFSLAFLGLLFRKLWRGIATKADAYYAAAFVPTILALAVHQLANTGVIGASFWTLNIYQITALFHVLLLSFGMGQRLQEMDHQRTIALEQSRESQRRAEQQRNFIAFLSHEFKAPLSRIATTAQMIPLTLTNLPESVTRRTDNIVGDSRKLMEMVERILTAEALAQGKLSLARETTPLTPLLTRIGEQTVGEEQRHRLHVEVSPATLVWPLDPYLLTLALGNALNNALAYSDPATPVSVRAFQEARRLHLVVRDQGWGMDAEEIGNFGAMYHRGKSSQGRSGTGLGAHIMRRAVETHGGQLRVDSTPGRGSTITLVFPPQGVEPLAGGQGLARR